MSASEEQSQGPVIKDRRRIDPVTGQPRAAEAGQSPRSGGQPRPGKHAVSKPGSPGKETGSGSDKAEAGTDEDQSEGGEGGSAKAAESEIAVKLAERTADLQRVQAE